MAHHASTVFKSPDPQQPIAVLLLIENSKNMAAIWPDLRDQYLRRLLDSIVAANPGAPVAVTILETSACNHGSPRSSPRPYLDTHQGLYTVNFDHSPENRVSPGKIDACINYLDTAKYSGQLCTARHLIVAAATAPSDDSTGMLIPENYSPWFSLSSKLATVR
ncbi:hypothetical protein NLJ89_g12027 [Agrocybe chaxingu]|uniref:Uncharacterized protein n=1 Tax=Agrocybe chaxingu TaxID=84603 RepID=A0A9W8MNV6_9AGAR|nr:hypothetical protein NLJ89_g12027 [Agrocybe chaxingu]